MPESKQTIIFDSSGLTALMNETDEFHTQALRMSEILTDRAFWRVILPHAIFAETVTALSKRVSREAGAKAARAILDRQKTGDFVFIETDALVYKTAIDLLQRAKGHRGAPSFFDCLVMAFAKNGYRLPAAENQQEAA